MKIQTETRGYNERRCSRPWIARVDFASNAQGDFKWGEWIGDARNGSAGQLEIDAEPGDIVAQGQKDFRKPRNSAPDWFIVEQDGTLRALAGKVEALRESRARASQPQTAEVAA